MTLRRLAVLSAVYPTREDAAKGRPIWATIAHFPRELSFRVHCTLPWRPAWFRRLIPPRSYLRYPSVVDASASWFETMPLAYPSLPGPGRAWNGSLLAHTVGAALADYAPDAILAFRAYPDGYAAVRAGQRLGVPAIVSVRGSDLKAAPRRGAVRRHTSTAVREADAVLAVSRDLAATAVELGALPERVHVMRNGVDRTTFHLREQAPARISLHVPANTKLVLFVGNLLPVKRVADLIEAVATLDASGIGDVQLAIIGDGTLEGALRRLAVVRRLGGRARFLGQCSPETVALWMAAADVLCLPSESEGMPNVVIEALSCGCPVVATAVGGTSEVLTDTCGALVPPGDVGALATALGSSLTKEWDREAIAARRHDSWTGVAAATLAVCDRVVVARRSAVSTL